jgi:hypothetical protein
MRDQDFIEQSLVERRLTRQRQAYAMADKGATLRVAAHFLDRRRGTAEPMTRIDAEIVPQAIRDDLDEVDTLADGVEHDWHGRVVKQSHQWPTRHRRARDNLSSEHLARSYREGARGLDGRSLSD